MRLIIYAINYYPELTGIGKYTGEMAEWLVKRGHEVRMVTAPPYYPQWSVGEGYSGGKYVREKIRGVDVLRCPLWVPPKPSGLKRIIHLASFAMTSLPVMLRQIFWKPDIVFVVEPPLFCAPGAWLVSRLSGARAWLHIQDFEVDAAFELGILAPGRLQDLVFFLEKILMKRFDGVSTISNRMLQRLLGKGVDSGKTFLFPNWVDTESIYPLDGSPMRNELGISREEIVCLYSGNMGEKQGIEILVEAAHLLRREKNIRFVFCGNGAARERIFESARHLDSIAWLPLQPQSKLNDLLNLADIHLLPQRSDAADLVMPSKLTGMLASGRPVVATVGSGTEIAHVLELCGRIVPPGDGEALAAAILELSKDRATRESLGREARVHALEHLGMDAVLMKFEETILGNVMPVQ